jgi:hypothetical protein
MGYIYIYIGLQKDLVPVKLMVSEKGTCFKLRKDGLVGFFYNS